MGHFTEPHLHLIFDRRIAKRLAFTKSSILSMVPAIVVLALFYILLVLYITGVASAKAIVVIVQSPLWFYHKIRLFLIRKQVHFIKHKLTSPTLLSVHCKVPAGNSCGTSAHSWRERPIFVLSVILLLKHDSGPNGQSAWWSWLRQRCLTNKWSIIKTSDSIKHASLFTIEY